MERNRNLYIHVIGFQGLFFFLLTFAAFYLLIFFFSKMPKISFEANKYKGSISLYQLANSRCLS